MERYVDEKHPEVVYEVIPVIEAVQPKPARPLWRRALRVGMTVFTLTFLFHTFAGLHTAMWHSCGRHPHMPYDEDMTVAPPLLDYTFSPDIDRFFVKQESFSAGVTRTEVIGRVVVASCSKAENISAHFKIESTDDATRDKVSIEAKKDGIVFKLDPFSLSKQTVNATLFLTVPSKDYKLKRFSVETIQLNVWLTESFTTPINATHISTVSGNIGSHGHDDKLLNSNNLKAESTSGGIYGDFPLKHALFLKTTSGDIKAHVISADRPEAKAWLKTESVSGNTTLAFKGGLNPRPLLSKHTSVNGPIHVAYPEDWQGALKISTTSGDIDIIGTGTKIIKKEKDITGKLWEVTKGEGKSKGYIGTVSGAVGVKFPILD